MNHSINEFTKEQKEFLKTIQRWYINQKDELHNIKVSWLDGLLKKDYYDETQKVLLNKMVFKYNSYLKFFKN